jgi:hypothetical protein
VLFATTPPYRSRRRRRPGGGLLATGVVAAVSISGCAVGERPTFDTTPFPPGEPSGDVTLDGLLETLDDGPTSPLTATYEVTPLLSGDGPPPTAVVVVDGPRWSVTIGDLRFISDPASPLDGSSERTCRLTDGTCEPGLVAQGISDTYITADFFGPSTARRLRRDALSLTAPAVASTETIAGRSAACATLSLPLGAAVYCASSTGVLARLRDSDIAYELVGLADSADSAVFRSSP